MNEFGPFTDNELPLQMDIFPKIDAWHPDIGYTQLEPDNHTDLVLDEVGNLDNGKGHIMICFQGQSDFDQELWDGEKLFFICANNSLGVEQAASPVVAFKCK